MKTSHLIAKRVNFKVISSGVVMLAGLFCFSCNGKQEIDFEQERKAILALDAADREYHFQKNAKAFVDSFSPGFLSINKGKIDRPSYEESFQRFDNYFKHVRFVAWDNLEEPVVRFSDDATVAYVAVSKRVILEFEEEAGKVVSDTTDFAWLSVYRKENNQWKLDGIASTNR